MTIQNDRNWIDISVLLHSGMAHWPGDPEPSFERISEIGQGAAANVTMCRMTAHTGTHMDAPCHFLDGKDGIDRFPLGLAVGPARVIGVPGVSVLGRAQLESENIQAGERVLFKTRNSDRRWDNQDFETGFVAFDASGARFLVERGVSLVGVDYLSIGLFKGDGVETHQVLLGAGVWILEGLNLSAVPEGEYELVCLPLRMADCDGSPARAILRHK
jgi:arylformamidase